MPDIWDQAAAANNPQQAAPSQAPPAQGDIWDQAAAINQQGGASTPPTDQTPADPSLQMNSGDNLGTTVAKGANAVGAGVGEGLLSTLNGGAEMLGLPHATLQERQDELTKQNAGNPILNKIGYGGETLAEMMMGDEALKALPLSKRLAAVAKSMDTLEKSPILIKALKIGADALQTGARTGIVQGAQTLARTGGDVSEAAKEGAEAGVTGGIIGGATGAAGDLLQSAGSAAEKATDLSDVAGNADTKEEVAKAIKEKIDTAKNDLHSSYETGVNDLQNRLKNTEVSAQENPLAAKAKERLADPIPEDHPLVSQAKEAAGDRLDKKVRDLMESISSGTLPEEEGAEAAAPKAPGLVGPDGNPIQSETPTEPEAKPAPPYKVGDLVQLRQTIRTLADSYDYGDVNSRALRSLLPAVDDTIGKLAEQSGDASAVSDYKALRSNYRDKINLFDEPVIQKLRDGKVDDAAKDFVGVARDGSALPAAGKTRFNVDTLRGIIGDDGVHDFAKKVFGTMLSDSVENGKLNPAKFVKSFNRVSDETKGQQFFDLEGANKGLKQLYQDAQSAANLQHLTRAGVLVPAAGAVGGLTGGGLGVGIGSLLGLTVAEGGGLQAGRDMLNYVANHPKVWAAYKTAANVASNRWTQGIGRAATLAGGGGAAAVLNPTPKTHVFNAQAWASHPQNKGKDVNAAIAEAKRQGYTITNPSSGANTASFVPQVSTGARSSWGPGAAASLAGR